MPELATLSWKEIDFPNLDKPDKKALEVDLLYITPVFKKIGVVPIPAIVRRTGDRPYLVWGQKPVAAAADLNWTTYSFLEAAEDTLVDYLKGFGITTEKDFDDFLLALED